MGRTQLAPHLPAYPKQQNAAREQQPNDLQQLNRDGSEGDAQDRGGQYADQNRFLALTLGQPGGCQPDGYNALCHASAWVTENPNRADAIKPWARARCFMIARTLNWFHSNHTSL